MLFSPNGVQEAKARESLTKASKMAMEKGQIPPFHWEELIVFLGGYNGVGFTLLCGQEHFQPWNQVADVWMAALGSRLYQG